MSDNRIFNVNGRSLPQLVSTIRLALLSEYLNQEGKVKGWKIDPEKGFILLSYVSKTSKDGGSEFPVPMSAESVSNMVWEWLQTEEAKKMKCEDWDADVDHDGSNEAGFRVYTEDWGRVGDIHGSIVAIRPAFLWYGK